MVAELGRTILNVSKITPGGIVVFFPSFKYANMVYSTWKEIGVLSQMEQMKKVFMEPKTAAEVDSVLSEYSKYCIIQGVDRKAGSIMLAVVGGKLSEGINFGDDLGRCVIMVGLPYPNPSDPELKERMNYMDRSFAENTGDSESSLTKVALSSREYYTNLCMKAVNQCIGRAIRHKHDYASIILLDYRYEQDTECNIIVLGARNDPYSSQCPGVSHNDGTHLVFRYHGSIGCSPGGIASKLPGWIVESMQPVGSFGEAQGRLARFFKQFQGIQDHS
jgi:chromosome transmission fidelity protein 1